MQRVHFIAIGGSSMHKLAIALSRKNSFVVSGSAIEMDEDIRVRLTRHKLMPEKEGWFPERIHKGLAAVIIGRDATADNPEYLRAKELGLKIYSVPDYLFHQTRSKTRIVIAGDSNRTIISAIVLFVLKSLRIDADYMISAETNGFDELAKLSYESRIAVFEGEEVLFSDYDPRPRFLMYKPQIAVITGIEWPADTHYRSEEQYLSDYSKFIESMEFQGRLIYNETDGKLEQLTQKLRRDIVAFGYAVHKHVTRDNDYYLVTRKGEVKVNLSGIQNMYNIEAARLTCKQIGVTDDQFYQTIVNFEIKH